MNPKPINKGKMKMKKILAMQWSTEGCTEAPYVFRLDAPGEGDRFFKVLSDNAERDGREKFELVEFTEKQWATIEQDSKEQA
jgi:hypothetical protein